MNRYIVVDQQGRVIDRIHCISLTYAARASKVLYPEFPDAMPLDWDRASSAQRHRAKQLQVLTQSAIETIVGPPVPEDWPDTRADVHSSADRLRTKFERPSFVPGMGNYRRATPGGRRV